MKRIVYTILIPHKTFTLDQAKKWITDHKYKLHFEGNPKVDVTKKKYWRFQQNKPPGYQTRFHFISLLRGIKVVEFEQF